MLGVRTALHAKPPTSLRHADRRSARRSLLRQRPLHDAVQQHHARGVAILLVDKNLQDVAALADRMLVLEKGRIVWSGAPAQLCGDAELQRRYLGV